MNYKVYFITRWFKDVRFCGGFHSMHQALSYVDFLQNKLPNGKKITFRIEQSIDFPRAA